MNKTVLTQPCDRSLLGSSCLAQLGTAVEEQRFRYRMCLVGKQVSLSCPLHTRSLAMLGMGQVRWVLLHKGSLVGILRLEYTQHVSTNANEDTNRSMGIAVPSEME
jgi:hypothetical protein